MTSMPDDWKLLAIERIFDCRCATTPPLLPPVGAQHSCIRLSARGPRCCKLDGKDAVDKENGLVTEEEMRENVEYLVLQWGTSSARRATLGRLKRHAHHALVGARRFR